MAFRSVCGREKWLRGGADFRSQKSEVRSEKSECPTPRRNRDLSCVPTLTPERQLRSGWGNRRGFILDARDEVPGFAKSFEAGGAGYARAFGIDADADEIVDRLHRNDVPGIVSDDIGGKKIDVVGGVGAVP